MPSLTDWLTFAAIIIFGTIFVSTVIASVNYERNAKIRKNREALIRAQATGEYTPDEPTVRLVNNNSAYAQYLKRQEMMLRQWDRKAADALIMDTAEEARRDFE